MLAQNKTRNDHWLLRFRPACDGVKWPLISIPEISYLMATLTDLLTAEDFLRLPPLEQPAELVPGNLVMPA
jgi:hypothetical protein